MIHTWLILGPSVVGLALILAGRRLGWLRYAGFGMLALGLGRLLLVETLNAVAARQPWLLSRALIFLAVGLCLGLVVPVLHRQEGQEQAARVAGVVFGLLPLWYLSLEIVLALDGRYNGRLAGNQAMWTAASWGLYGLLAALAEVRLRARLGRDDALFLRGFARFVLLAALGYLTVAALPGNGRWAVLPVRLVAYSGVLGSIWLVEWLHRRVDPDDDAGGVLATAAALAGAFALSFEVDRFLEPLFTLPPGEFLTWGQFYWQQSTGAFAHSAVWGGYGILLLAVGRLLRSATTRHVSAGVLGFALLYTTILALRNLAAPPALRLAAFLLVTGGSLAAALIGLRAPDRLAWSERITLRVLLAATLTVGSFWGVLELMN